MKFKNYVEHDIEKRRCEGPERQICAMEIISQGSLNFQYENQIIHSADKLTGNFYFC